MAVHHVQGTAIRTSHDYPPIPDRRMDWSAVEDGTYDCDCDQDGFFSAGPIGHGATEQEAIDDLVLQMEEVVISRSRVETHLLQVLANVEDSDA